MRCSAAAGAANMQIFDAIDEDVDQDEDEDEVDDENKEMS